jgi:hypothetical protein
MKRRTLPERGGPGNGDLSLLRHSCDVTRKDEQYCRMLLSQSNLEAEWWAGLVWMFLGKSFA